MIAKKAIENIERMRQTSSEAVVWGLGYCAYIAIKWWQRIINLRFERIGKGDIKGEHEERERDRRERYTILTEDRGISCSLRAKYTEDR